MPISFRYLCRYIKLFFIVFIVQFIVLLFYQFPSENYVDVEKNVPRVLVSCGIPSGENALENRQIINVATGGNYTKNNPIITGNERLTSSDKGSPNWLSQIPTVWTRFSDSIYFYSAYWDNRYNLKKGPFARAIGLFKYKDEAIVKEHNFRWTGIIKPEYLNITCYLWYDTKPFSERGTVSALVFEEAHTTFVGTFFNCLPSTLSNFSDTTPYTEIFYGSHRVPYAVSFLPLHSSPDFPHKIIYLRNTTLDRPANNKTSICVRGLYGPYDDVKYMTQFISFYKEVLGIRRFFFYDLALGLQVRKFLGHLNAKKLADIEIAPWNLPTGEWSELWDLGSLAALNDCVYRSMSTNEYVVIVDLDEFIVPSQDGFKTIPTIYSKSIEQRRGTVGDSVVVLNQFFCSEYTKEKSTKDPTNLKIVFPIFYHEQEEDVVWPTGQRSKMILTPSFVEAVGHHLVHRFINETLVNRSASLMFASLHHYRSCKDIRHGIRNNGRTVLERKSRLNRKMFKFKDSVMNSNVMKVYVDLFSE